MERATSVGAPVRIVTLLIALEARHIGQVSPGGVAAAAASHTGTGAAIRGPLVPGHQDRRAVRCVGKLALRTVGAHAGQVLCA
eukprot:scaffold5713_cov124-Isochrysis_galbana.AAC.1